MQAITFRKYVKEVLKNAVYEKGESSKVIIAEALDLSGCFTRAEILKRPGKTLLML